MRARRLSIAAVPVLLAVLVFAPGAQACSCTQASPRQALRDADAAIVGRLVRVVPRNRRWADYRYRVLRAYKGGRRLRGTVSVRSSTGSASCGLPRRRGRSYGLLLRRGGGRWWGGLCGVLPPRKLRAAARQRAGPSAGASSANCAS